MVVLGRPKRHRGSYKQWEEEDIPPQVVFEVASPGNTQAEWDAKLAFYEQYGVLEYYTNRASEVHQLPPSLRFPPLREGNRVGRVGSVPPASRGNLKEGVIGHTRFCELMLVHLQLREYRLREGRYPDSLEPLNLQELAIDPFMGQPFGYRLTGERYQLSSAGGIS